MKQAFLAPKRPESNKQRKVKIVQQQLPTWFINKKQNQRSRPLKNKINPKARDHKEGGVSPMCTLHNDVFVRLRAAISSLRYPSKVQRFKKKTTNSINQMNLVLKLPKTWLR